jgi:hypothetical protein
MAFAIEVVKIVIKGPERIREIIEWGAKFDKDDDGTRAGP